MGKCVKSNVAERRMWVHVWREGGGGGGGVSAAGMNVDGGIYAKKKKRKN